MMYVFLVLLVIAMIMHTRSTGAESFEPNVDKARCRKYASRSTWPLYFWRVRRNFGTEEEPNFKCPRGWQNTGCASGHGKEFENKQCRRKRPVVDPIIEVVTDVAPPLTEDIPSTTVPVEV